VKRVGVLALQGDFEAHRKAVDRAGARAVEVRTADELNACDALIIPGGESSTMLKLLDLENLTPAIRDFAAKKPVLGTCAGAILMAREVTHPQQASLGLMDITVERNGYGRQIDSRIAKVNAEGGEMEAVFIRAPVIRRAGPEAQVLATYQGNPVWVEQGLHTAATFHPELTEDPRLHRRFLAKVLDSE
jgi:pyridoxal 5'-phosphate synthase pdxT subunit